MSARLFFAALMLLALLGAGVPALAQEAKADAKAEARLQVTDPFLELRTGAGRGYPIFHVAARGEWVVIELRATDWYKVRTDSGKQGWVQRKQLESTLTEAGAAVPFRDVVVDDYLKRRVEIGAAWGQYSSEPMLKLWGAWRFSDTLSTEFTVGQVQGVYSGTDFWHLNLNVEPWSDKRLSPYFGIGFGRLSNVPNASLVDAETTDANIAVATLGVRWYLAERFVLRADYTLHNAFVADTNYREFKAFSAGLAFFF